MGSDSDDAEMADNGLRLKLAPFKLEHLQDYEPGGHHPVQLGDTLGDDGRYIVVHKLGHGGFANVWLCRDTRAQPLARYVALKILMTDVSVEEKCSELRVIHQLKAWSDAESASSKGAGYICLPLDKFDIDGPNGTHYCFVYPVLGPKVSLGLCRGSEDPDLVLRSVCFKVVEAIAFLHGHGMCHGDLTPINILHRISGLDGLSEDALLKTLGEPRRNKIYHRDSESDNHDNPSAPQYLVYPIDWHAVDSKYISSDPCVIDFGESFTASQPPEQLGIPGPYRSPELILEHKAGYGSDLWALGCTLFEIRTGRRLFDMFDDEDDVYLDAIVEVLGKMPEPWWSTTWAERKRLYEDQADESGKAIAVGDEEQHDVMGVNVTVHPSVAQVARSLMDKLAPGLWHLSDERDCHREVSYRERELFADLLGKLLTYAPEERISAEDALQHDWFKYEER
ncbi:kinase-like protein [Coniochaeta ligniaria NRRL 30616]|uniref:Kinase-like protein n=1 Tax=Coniochaeta ligniaria NRRL 30616 TaxID=1408157 RepID=A0A1J7J749_9PEZI|nr:kinase-like protein [Coniochaeta ligniaria NRRL 30616]